MRLGRLVFLSRQWPHQSPLRTAAWMRGVIASSRQRRDVGTQRHCGTGPRQRHRLHAGQRLLCALESSIVLVRARYRYVLSQSTDRASMSGSKRSDCDEGGAGGGRGFTCLAPSSTRSNFGAIYQQRQERRSTRVSCHSTHRRTAGFPRKNATRMSVAHAPCRCAEPHRWRSGMLCRVCRLTTTDCHGHGEASLTARRDTTRSDAECGAGRPCGTPYNYG